MANFLENLGLDSLRESVDAVIGLIGHTVESGKSIVGYYGSPYLNRSYRSVQIIVRAICNDASKNFEVSGMDTHISGNCVWTVQLSGININRKDSDYLERRVIVNHADGSDGMAVVNLVNADVLPSFAEGEIVKMQMVAFPTIVEYYSDEAAYESAQPRSRDGKLFLLAPGTILPSGLLLNHSPDSKHYNEDEYNDDYVLVRGTVKRLYNGDFELEGQRDDIYIRCVIDTEFGELELAHTYEQVPEAMRRNIREGAIVNSVCVLSGDVAIYEYENGLVLDEEHDLMALRYAFYGGDPQRILSIFASGPKFESEGLTGKFTADMIAAFFNDLIGSVKSKNETITVRMARVVSVQDTSAAKYAPGKRCLAVSVSEPELSTTYVFIDVNSSGKITGFHMDPGKGYQFRFDKEPPKNEPPEDFRAPESVVESMFNRAQFNGLLAPGMTLEEINRALEEPSKYAGHIAKILAAKPRDLLSGEKKYFANLFGYIFAKSAELEYAETHRGRLFKSHPTVTVIPADAWVGRYSTVFGEKTGKELEKLMELGKPFQKDYTFYRGLRDLEAHGDDPDFDKALRTVCLFGAIYSREHLK